MAKAKQPNPRQREQQPSWFDKLSPLKKDLVCIAALYVLVLILFNKIIFSNMVFSEGGDSANSIAWQKAAEHVRDVEQGKDPQWVPYAFSGMPSFASLSVPPPKEVNYLQYGVAWLGQVPMFFAKLDMVVLFYLFAGVFMFLLARTLKFSQLPSLIAALTLMLNPVAIGVSQAGQFSKLMALSYIPLLFLLTYRLFERRDVLSFGLLAAVVGTTLLTDHVQMAFYGFLVIGCYVLYEVILELKRQPLNALKNVVLFGCAVVLGFAISSYVYLSVHEYTQYSIRGGGETGVAGGLDYGYATGWSLHPFETLNYLIPSFFGFSSEYVADWQGQMRALPLYWGWMPFTTSTVYIGILPIILGIIALVYQRNRLTIFLAILSVIVLLMSFGNYFPILYDPLFHYFPFFNRFRAPSMILHLMPITFGLLAAYGVAFLSEVPVRAKEMNLVKLKKRLKVGLGILGGLLVVGLIAKGVIYDALSGFMFVKEGDIQQYGRQVVDIFKEKRFDLLFNDFVKFVIFAGVIFGLILAYFSGKVQRTFFVLGLIAILVIDLWIIDGNYVDPKPPQALEQTFVPDLTVSSLMKDTTFYRIYPIGYEYFRDRSYMFMSQSIRSVGGYSPAKIRIYQEMIDSVGLLPPRFPMNMNVLNMLCTKYIVSPGRLPETNLQIVQADQSSGLLTYLNPNCFPHAWFVDSIVVAKSKHEVFQILNSPLFDARRTAILEKEPSVHPSRSDSAGASVSTNNPHEITLDAYASKASLLVLSEVYYPPAWKAFVDGKEKEIYKTNYVLRSIVVPPGKHSIEFRFDSPMYTLGYTITQSAWGITIVIILIGVFRIPAVRSRLVRRREGKKAVSPAGT